MPFSRYDDMTKTVHQIYGCPADFPSNSSDQHLTTEISGKYIHNKSIIIKYIKLIRTIKIILIYNALYIYIYHYIPIIISFPNIFPDHTNSAVRHFLHRWASRPCATAQQNKWLDLAEMDAMTQKTDI